MNKVAVALVFAVGCGGGGKQAATPTSGVPAAVTATLQREAAGAPIEGVEQETEDGIAVFEGHWHKDGKLVEATVKPDGTLVEREEEIEAADVPEAARTAAQAQLGGTQPTKWVRLQDGSFEAEGTVDGKERDVKVDASGKLLGTESDTGDHDGAHEDRD